ncbi:MAG: serine--tRNA ligase, partial [Acidimicrobiales bacterium]
MLDVRRFRNEFDVVRAGLARRGDDLSSLDRVRSLDERQRELAA